MQTYSHLLVNAIADRSLRQRSIPVHSWAFLVGSVIPDLPFLVLSLLGEVYYRFFSATPTGESPMVYMHFTLYFNDPLWITAHNFFHAPFILGGLAAAGYFTSNQANKRWGNVLLWLALGAGVHTLLDIGTHAGDGPLLLFPLNWQWRIDSPVSYWDPDHYGRIFSPLEHLLDLTILGYLLYVRITRKQPKTQTGHGQEKKS